MKILIDAMGGDNAPAEVVKGAVLAAKDFTNIEIILIGDEMRIYDELKKYDAVNIKTVHAPGIVEAHDDPTTVIRNKKDSSMVMGLNMLNDGGADAFVSAGNTGALATGATLIVKRIKGIRRAAIGALIPTTEGFVLVLDVGATAECQPKFLVQFAVMGSIYMNKLFDIQSPRIGLVNIGTEEDKGTVTVANTNKLLKKLGSINYTGNVEAREIPFGRVDVAVCDGFVGNVILKLVEGVGLAMFGMIKEVFMKNAVTKLAAMIVKSGLKGFKKRMDYSEYGGAPLLGIQKPVIKAHGSSDSKAFYHAIRQAIKYYESGIIFEISKHAANDKEE